MASTSRRNKRAGRNMVENSPTLPLSAAAEDIGWNTDLLIQIFICLPPKSLFRFKQVCRSWHDLISSATFSRQLESKPANSLYIFKSMLLGGRRWNSKYDSRIIEYCSIPLDDVVRKSIPNPQPLVNLPAFIGEPVLILDSCKGLLLCCSPEVYQARRRRGNYFICNPVTKQFTKLPSPYGHRGTGATDSMNLAVYLSHSLQYKVLAISLYSGDSRSSTMLQIEVYSSENRTWKLCEETSGDISYPSGAFWNSAVHWPRRTSGRVVYFDINNESWGSAPMPPLQGNISYFGESNGHLHLVYIIRDVQVEQVVVYELNKDYSEWFVKYQFDLSDVDVRPAKKDEKTNKFHVCCVARREHEEESFMVFGYMGTCYAYNLIKGTSKKLCNIQYGRMPFKVVHQQMENPTEV